MWKLVSALQEYIDVFIIFPGHLDTLAIKEGFYKLAGQIISDAAHLFRFVLLLKILKLLNQHVF